MESNSTIVPRLAAVPVRPARSSSVVRRIARKAYDHYAPSGLTVAFRWFSVVDSTYADHRLTDRHFNVVSEPNAKGQSEYLWTEKLTNESHRVLKRLSFLISEVSEALETDDGSVVVDGLAQTMRQIAVPLLWDAALDLQLADHALAEAAFQSGAKTEAFRTARAWADAPPGAVELRARVLYAIEGLALIYGSAIERRIEIRLGEESFASAQLEDALNWFRCYAEVHAEARAALDPPKSLTRRWAWLTGRRQV